MFWGMRNLSISWNRVGQIVLFRHFTDVTDGRNFRKQAAFDQRGDLVRARTNLVINAGRSRQAKRIRQFVLMRLLYQSWQAYGALENVRGPSLKGIFGA